MESSSRMFYFLFLNCESNRDRVNVSDKFIGNNQTKRNNRDHTLTNENDEDLSVDCFDDEWIKMSREIYLDHSCPNEDNNVGGTEDVITDHVLKTLEDNASRKWNLFYRRNTDKFFKDRHYLTKVFPEMCEKLETGKLVKIIEVGCGVANTIIPLLERYPNCYATTIDFAPSAIELLRTHRLHDNVRLSAFVCDITIPSSISWKENDFATMIFVLSAIAPEKMEATIQNVKNSLKPGGMVLFRDYAQYDMAQLRFSKSQRLGHNFYVRHDGTRSFFFTLEGVERLFKQCGLRRVHSSYIRRKVVNHKENKVMRRIFVNACYMKPEEQ